MAGDMGERVALLGNSHVLAVESALRASLSDYGHVTCFDGFHVWNEIAPEQEGRNFSISVRSIAGKETKIDLDVFDTIVVCAGGWWAGRNASFQENGNSHPLAHVALPTWRQTDLARHRRFTLVSQNVLDETIYRWVNQHRISDLVRLMSRSVEKSIIWQPWPAPNRELLADPEWILNSYYGEGAGCVWAEFFRSQYKALTRISAEAGSNVRLLPYPLSGTLAEGFMAAEYCDTDPFHANAIYGALVLSQLDAYIR